MHDTVSTLHSVNFPIADLLVPSAHWPANTLGALCYGVNSVQPQIDAPHCVCVPMQRLDSDDSFCEVWQGCGKVRQGQFGDIRYRHDDDVLFGVIELSEQLYDASVGTPPLQQATDAAYRQILSLIDKLHYPYLFRVWNYFSDINAHSFGLERYRQFNLGRQDAFLAHGHDVAGNVPAASALGASSGPLTIVFLAGRVTPLNIENPRQISAYHYPQEYGPRSPVFSRASLVRLGQEAILFVSGTASIVGHATVHPSNVAAQTRETMTNIEAVLAEANRFSGHPRFQLVGLYYKVYVRHPSDLPQVRAELTRCVGDQLKAVYLQADVCRQDLLIEIEATAGHPLAQMTGAEN